ncbi:nicotinamide-nucleotide amidase [Micromonospora rhizosphaerae]|uniref:Nicotinamide-nucleotide amidase n=1 Tax=Micromonospora rhizosphaerae TaxID=568872 RepID=A0A1C6RX60_9ACTN|nr:nicotinamide-nucleotide amidase [Micromonospora rhizosphaerae]
MDERDANGERPAGSPAAAVVHSLSQRHETLATIESLTGGLLSASIVEIAGVSGTYRGGLVVYATELKSELAGVPADLLAERGPVDPDVAVALAEGGRRRCGADWGLATTGVAGPEPQDGKPVGLVYVAVAGPGGTSVEQLDLEGGRDHIRSAAVIAALRLLTERIRAADQADESRPADATRHPAHQVDEAQDPALRRPAGDAAHGTDIDTPDDADAADPAAAGRR